jgi:hypothetical protein
MPDKPKETGGFSLGGYLRPAQVVNSSSDFVSPTMRLDNSIPPRMRIFLISLFASFLVLVVSLVIQWIVYDDWLRRTGPLRIVGTTIAAVITLCFMLRWQYSVHEQQREMIRRFELISHMNDRIRNALQVIECVAYVSRPEATEIVRQEVDAIDRVLRDVLSDPSTLAEDRFPKQPSKASGQSG